MMPWSVLNICGKLGWEALSQLNNAISKNVADFRKGGADLCPRKKQNSTDSKDLAERTQKYSESVSMPPTQVQRQR